MKARIKLEQGSAAQQGRCAEDWAVKEAGQADDLRPRGATVILLSATEPGLLDSKLRMSPHDRALKNF